MRSLPLTYLQSKLKSPPLWLALQVELRTAAVTYGDTAKTLMCITRVLTTFIAHEQSLADEAAANGSGRALPGMNADKPHSGKDPAKTGLNRKGTPKTPCPLCKKPHWKSQCFQNSNADEDTMKLAARIAPKSPAAQSYFKKHPDLAPPPPKLPAAEKDKEGSEDGAGLTLLEDNQVKDVVAAATAKHRAAIGLNPVTKRTPAQQHFLSVLSSSPVGSPGSPKSSKASAAAAGDSSGGGGGAAAYRRKKATGLAIMHERRRVSELISNVEKLDHQLSGGPGRDLAIPPLRLSALAPKPLLRSYNLLDDEGRAISSSDDDDDSLDDLEEVDDLEGIL